MSCHTSIIQETILHDGVVSLYRGNALTRNSLANGEIKPTFIISNFMNEVNTKIVKCISQYSVRISLLSGNCVVKQNVYL